MGAKYLLCGYDNRAAPKKPAKCVIESATHLRLAALPCGEAVPHRQATTWPLAAMPPLSAQALDIIRENGGRAAELQRTRSGQIEPDRTVGRQAAETRLSRTSNYTHGFKARSNAFVFCAVAC